MRRRNLLASTRPAAGLVAAGLLLAGCGGGTGGSGADKPATGTRASAGAEDSGTAAGKGGDTGDRPTTPAHRPLVTVAQANAIFDHYQKVNDAANKTRDAKLLGTVEGGALLQFDEQVFQQFRALPAKYQAEYGTPYTYTKRKFFIPDTGDWFMATAYMGHPGAEHDYGLIVFRKTGQDWKMVVANDYDGTLPQVATTPQGAVTVVPSDATVGGTELSGLGDAITDLRVTGGKKAGKELGDSAVRRDAVKAYTTRDDHWGSYKSCLLTQYQAPNPKYDTPYTKFPGTYAVRTADGGALVASISYYAEGDFSTHPGSCTFNVSDTTAVYVGNNEKTSLRSRYGQMNVVSVPAAGKPVQLGGVAVLVGATS